MNNPNHPIKGSTIKVDPIRKLKHIEAIKELLKDNPRNLCLFTLGINTNLRASDLVNLTINQVAYLNPGDELCIKEKKTGKLRCISLNQKVITAITALIGDLSDPSEHLFQSRKVNCKISVS